MTTTAVSPAPSKTQFALWVQAARPKTLPAAISPVVVGCAVAWREGSFALLPAVAAFAVALLLQIAANLANDVADFMRGADTSERLGPTRVTQSGLIAAERVVAATALTLALAAIPGLYLVWLGGPAFAALGALAGLAAVAYTAGPKPFGYLGLGELFVFIFFGPVAVIGTASVMTHQLTPLAVWTSVPMGCLVSAILVVNNLRDIETDRAAGKRTLAVRLGSDATRIEYALLVAVSYLVPALMLVANVANWWVLLPWITVPMAALLTRQVWTTTGRALNPVLGGTARLALWFAVTFAAGLLR